MRFEQQQPSSPFRIASCGGGKRAPRVTQHADEIGGLRANCGFECLVTPTDESTLAASCPNGIVARKRDRTPETA